MDADANGVTILEGVSADRQHGSEWVVSLTDRKLMVFYDRVFFLKNLGGGVVNDPWRFIAILGGDAFLVIDLIRHEQDGAVIFSM